MVDTASRTRLIIGVIFASIAILASALVTGTSSGAAGPPATPSADPPAHSVTANHYYYNFGAISLACTGGAVGWSQ